MGAAQALPYFDSLSFPLQVSTRRQVDDVVFRLAVTAISSSAFGQRFLF